MLICRIYDLDDKEQLALPITHFSERVSQSTNGVESLSCVFRVQSHEANNAIEQYKKALSVSIGKIVFTATSDETPVAEYTKYHTVDSIQIDYGVSELTGIVLFKM